MVWGPTTAGEQLTAQLLLAAPVWGLVLAPPRVQLAKAVLETSAVKLTVPLGALAEVGVLSFTFAVQLLWLPTGPVLRSYPTRRSSDRLRAVTTKAPELPRWLASPP